MSGVKIRLEGFEELARALRRADAVFAPLASRAIAVSLEAIEQVISPYPPQPDRMRSGHFNGYVRGQGRYPKSAFYPDTAEPGGWGLKRGRKGQVKLTSQQMDKKFRTSVTREAHRIHGELRNDATYSGWVIGPKQGDPHQVPWHAETGWVNADDAIDQATPAIEGSMSKAIDDLLEGFAR